MGFHTGYSPVCKFNHMENFRTLHSGVSLAALSRIVEWIFLTWILCLSLPSKPIYLTFKSLNLLESQFIRPTIISLNVIFLVMSNKFSLLCSNYPARRVTCDTDGNEMGVMGTTSLLQNATLSTQPISNLDWSPDKQGMAVCTSFDQTIRIIIVTKLNTL